MIGNQSTTPWWLTQEGLDQLRQGENGISGETYDNAMAYLNSAPSIENAEPVIPYGTSLTDTQQFQPEVALEPETVTTAPSAVQITPEIVKAVRKVESNNNENAISNKNAIGAMQVTPIAFRELMRLQGTPVDDLTDAQIIEKLKEKGASDKYGVDYLNSLVQQNPNYNLEQVLAAYNGGPSRLNKLRGDYSKMPDETVKYVQKVMSLLGKEGQNETQQQPVGAQTSQQPQQQAQAVNPWEQEKQVNAATALELANLQDEQNKVFYQTQQENIKADKQLYEAQQRRQAELARLNSEYSASIDKFNALSVDPRRLVKNQSTIDTIMSAIAIGIGGFASGMTGRPNVALEIINNAIDKDIEAQKVEIEKAGGVMKAKQSLLNDLRQRFGDEVAAETAYRNIMAERTKNLLANFATQTQNTKMKAELARMSAQTGQEQLKYKNELSKQLENSPVGQSTAIDMYIAEWTKARNTAGQPPDVNTLPEKARERFVPDIGFASDPQTAEKVREAKMEYNAAISEIAKIRTLMDKEGIAWLGGNFNRTYYGELEALTGSLQDRARRLGQMGALDVGAREQVKLQIPTIEELTQFFPSKGQAKLNQFESRLKNDVQNKVKSYIPTPLPGWQGMFENANTMTQPRPAFAKQAVQPTPASKNNMSSQNELLPISASDPMSDKIFKGVYNKIVSATPID